MSTLAVQTVRSHTYQITDRGLRILVQLCERKPGSTGAYTNSNYKCKTTGDIELAEGVIVPAGSEIVFYKLPAISRYGSTDRICFIMNEAENVHLVVHSNGEIKKRVGMYR